MLNFFNICLTMVQTASSSCKLIHHREVKRKKLKGKGNKMRFTKILWTNKSKSEPCGQLL